MEEITVFTIYGNCPKNSKILKSINDLIKLAPFGGVLALMIPQEDGSEINRGLKLKGL